MPAHRPGSAAAHRPDRAAAGGPVRGIRHLRARGQWPGLALDAQFYRRARAPYLADKLAQAVQAGLRGELEIVGGVAAHDAEQPARLRKSIAPGCDDRAEGRARLVRMAQAEGGPAALNLVTEICGPPSAGAANATTKPRPPATSPATRTSRTCPDREDPSHPSHTPQLVLSGQPCPSSARFQGPFTVSARGLTFPGNFLESQRRPRVAGPGPRPHGHWLGSCARSSCFVPAWVNAVTS